MKGLVVCAKARPTQAAVLRYQGAEVPSVKDTPSYDNEYPIGVVSINRSLLKL